MVVMINDVQIDIVTHLLMVDVFMTDSVKYFNFWIFSYNN